MMKIYKQNFENKISTVKIGKENIVNIGGDSNLPFYDKENFNPNVAISFEILDKAPINRLEWSEKDFKSVWNNTGDWALKCKNDFGAEIICLYLLSSKLDEGATDEKHAIEAIKSVLDKTNLPLIVRGSGNADVDNKILPVVCREFKGENLVIASVILENYREIALSALENGHCIVAESPIDINIAKQLNIILKDLGFSQEKILCDPTTGAVGYGLEYCCSIMERARLASLNGDVDLSAPFINFVGSESWRGKEAEEIGSLWESMTAQSCILSGSSIAVMRDYRAVEILKESILK